MLVGYARVSTSDQNLELQLEELARHGCERVFTDKATGTNTDRAGLREMLDFVREGDTLVVVRLDRFARSLVDLYQMLDRLTQNGVAFQCLRQFIDTSSSTGKLTLAILGAVAEFENDLRRERQRDGIARAKDRGIYRGRKPSIDKAEVASLCAKGMGPAQIAASLGISRTSVYRVMAQGMGTECGAHTPM
jgi:DNA invertase Pin-like site-specific DNA recombinase